MTPTILKLELPAEMVQLIGAALMELPYKVSAPTIEEINRQVTPQVTNGEQIASAGSLTTEGLQNLLGPSHFEAASRFLEGLLRDGGEPLGTDTAEEMLVELFRLAGFIDGTIAPRGDGK